jgi:hypothetical protein
MGAADYLGLPFDDPRRVAFREGCRAEAVLRDAPRKAADPDVKQLLDYADALVKHEADTAASTGLLLAAVTRVFSSTLTREDRRAIRRALRGKR